MTGSPGDEGVDKLLVSVAAGFGMVVGAADVDLETPAEEQAVKRNRITNGALDIFFIGSSGNQSTFNTLDDAWRSENPPVKVYCAVLSPLPYEPDYRNQRQACRGPADGIGSLRGLSQVSAMPSRMTKRIFAPSITSLAGVASYLLVYRSWPKFSKSSLLALLLFIVS